MDAILMSHKGRVEPEKPLFAVKRAEVAPSRLPSEGMLFCAQGGGFVSTSEKLHSAFAEYDAKEERHATAEQRSRAVAFGGEDSDTDSDHEECTDEEAEELVKFMSGVV
ncbi:hypothetical protein, conserved [Eimeria necatrix]|uniref:Uncharacterized protein n=1 Tax=Eimeria necatrix TaxID=51315 RepID=U6MUB0_9EIME|nr:hypothetical protein, conserved [Eimeria necatrix]CDJ67566.1 hypothetical protein, conserved [Eimeria necatrix]